MIDTKTKLSVLHDDNGSFADRSEESVDFSRDTFAIALNQSEDYLYLGYAKPFGAAYCEFATANTNVNTLAAEYWNGTEWTALADFRDITKGFTRSGFMTWTKLSTDVWPAKEVEGETKYWIRLRPDVTHSATSVSGINIVFADDYDLQTEFPSVMSAGFIPSGETSHIKTHVAVRSQIVQDLRNMGYSKRDAEGNVTMLNVWDLHDIEEVRQAAIWLALAKIFFNYSDDDTDTWAAKSKAYEARYKSTLDLLKVSTDANDDGNQDASEKFPSRVVRMQR